MQNKTSRGRAFEMITEEGILCFVLPEARGSLWAIALNALFGILKKDFTVYFISRLFLLLLSLNLMPSTKETIKLCRFVVIPPCLI
eukprot:scaffold1508_cov182-Ochromonas_danica.AAC.10